MSIFNRRDSEPQNPPPQKAPPRPAPRPASAEPPAHDRTHIASGSRVVGEISGAAELVIDGHVEGKIGLDSRLVVGSSGRVEGEIEARSIEISGRVLGNVRGLERVEVLRSGRLEGDMVAPQNGVHIAEGAFFSGKIEMTRSGEPTKLKTSQRSAGERQPVAAGAPAGNDKESRQR